MSKRRKIEKKKSSEVSKDNPKLVKFKKELLNLVSGSQMDKCLNWFFKNSNQRKFYYHKTVADFKFNWVNKSGEDKVIVVEVIGGNEAGKLLRNAISRLNLIPLREIAARYLSKEISIKSLSKEHLVDELENFYFERVGSYEKRKLEKKNISNLMEDEGDYDLRFLYMCGESIPRELLILILGFLGYKNDTLFQVGSVCKTLYYTILTSWPYIRIKKKNVYEISIAVLKSVGKITFEGDKFLTAELTHIFNHVSSERLREIDFYMKISSFAKILRYFLKLSKKKSNNIPSFRNVVSITYSLPRSLFTKNGVRKSDVTDYEKLFNFDLNQVFPNLREFHNPINLKFLSEYNLEKLTLDLRLPFRVKQEINDKGSETAYKNIIPSQIKFLVNKERMRKLYIKIPVLDGVGIKHFHKLFTGFSNVEELVIEVSPKYGLNDNRYVFYSSSVRSRPIDILSCFLPLTNLRKLCLLDFSMLYKGVENMGVYMEGKQVWRFPSSFPHDFLGRLEEIEIKDLVSRGKEYSHSDIFGFYHVLRTMDDLLFCLGLNYLKRIDIELGLQKNNEEEAVKYLLLRDYLENKMQERLEYLRIDFFYSFNVKNATKKDDTEGFKMTLLYMKKKRSFRFEVSDWKSSKSSFLGFADNKSDHAFTTVAVKEVLLMNMLLTELPKILSRMRKEKRIDKVFFVDDVHFIKNTGISKHDPPKGETWKDRMKRRLGSDNKKTSEEEEKLRLYSLFKKKMEEEKGIMSLSTSGREVMFRQSWRKEFVFFKIRN